MAETEAIAGIYGAVDRAVQDDPEARARVATLLDPYQDPQFHWFDEFQDWLGITKPDSSEPPSAQLEGALGHLAEIEPSRPRARARRMFAIAVATRAFPALQEPESGLTERAVSALHPESFEAEVPAPEAAKGLYELLREQDWDAATSAAVADKFLPSLRGVRPRPCCSRLVTVPGVAGAVAAFETNFVTTELTFDAATRLIEPLNWPDCMPNFWCDMRLIRPEVVPGQREYHEVVSSNCAAGANAWFYAETDLLFDFMWLPNKQDAEAALANYRLAAGRPQPNDRIRVDEGTLLVAKVNKEDKNLRITTTKRIQFDVPFSSQVLVMIMCVLGYADVAASLACCTARDGAPPVDSAGKPLPDLSGASLDATMKDAAPLTPCAAGSGSPGHCCQTNLGALVQDTASIWARTLGDCAAALERGAGQACGPPGRKVG